MKPRMMSKQAMDLLFDHILDGFEGSYKGIENLEQQGLVSENEIHELLKKNSERLIDRVKEFKLMQKLTCIFFACMFGWLQISGEDLEMRRGRSGRRKDKSEMPVYL
jgi:hypothetical protein